MTPSHRSPKLRAPRPLPAALLLGATLLGPATPALATETQAAHGEFLGAMETVYPGWFKTSFLDFEEDIDEAAEQGKRLMLFFHQDGCPYCNRMVELNLAQKDIQDTMRKHLDVVAINMWGDREVVTVGGRSYTEKTLAEALKVQFTPTLIFFDEGGKVALRLNGYLPPASFGRALEYVTGRHERSGSYAEYLQNNRPVSASGKLREQAFFESAPHDLRRAAGEDRPLAVFFEQAECPNCDTLHDKVLSDPQTRELASRFRVVQLDMWSRQSLITPGGERISAREWARRLNVSYAPTIILFGRDDQEVIRSEAFFKVFHTQSLFDYVWSAQRAEFPSFQRYISARAEALRERGVDVDIWR